MVRSHLQSSSPREKEKNVENSHKAFIGNWSCGRSPPIYRHLVWGFFIKTLIIMSISTNIHRLYVCDPLGPYISLVNNSIDQITPYWSTIINYPYPHIDLLIEDRFNLIDRLSCQPVRCQATPRTVGDIGYVRTHLWNLSVIDETFYAVVKTHKCL